MSMGLLALIGHWYWVSVKLFFCVSGVMFVLQRFSSDSKRVLLIPIIGFVPFLNVIIALILVVYMPPPTLDELFGNEG
jgi:hypothetical protein